MRNGRVLQHHCDSERLGGSDGVYGMTATRSLSVQVMIRSIPVYCSGFLLVPHCFDWTPVFCRHSTKFQMLLPVFCRHETKVPTVFFFVRSQPWSIDAVLLCTEILGSGNECTHNASVRVLMYKFDALGFFFLVSFCLFCFACFVLMVFFVCFVLFLLAHT